MARKRTIDPDSWTDDKIAELSIGAHLLWVGLVSLADDEGRLKWSAGQFKRRLFPSKDSVTIADIEKWMAEILASTGDGDESAVICYKSNGRLYAYHPNWRENQYVNKPSKSKLPIPPFPSSNSGSVTESDATPPASPGRSGSVTKSSVPSVSVSVSDTESESVSVSESGKTTTPGLRFCLWFLDAAVASNVLGEHNKLDPNSWAYKQLGDANELLGIYGEELCKAKSLALFRAIAAGKIRRGASVATLKTAWDFDYLRPMAAVEDIPESMRQIIAELRAAEG